MNHLHYDGDSEAVYSFAKCNLTKFGQTTFGSFCAHQTWIKPNTDFLNVLSCLQHLDEFSFQSAHQTWIKNLSEGKLLYNFLFLAYFSILGQIKHTLGNRIRIIYRCHETGSFLSLKYLTSRTPRRALLKHCVRECGEVCVRPTRLQ